MERRSQEVIPGLWALPLPLSQSGLAVVYSYALEVRGGIVLVDSGWGSRRSFTALERRLAEIGASVSDVRGVLFTHAHPDHYGGAGEIQKRSGAWLAAHPAEHIIRPDSARPEFFAELAAEAGLAVGGPGDRASHRPDLSIVDPDRGLTDGELLELGPWRVRVVHTPGHSAGHVCFLIDDARVALIGDHVLSRTTPNVSHWPGGNGDPLGDYIASLGRIAGKADGYLGLPGHEDRVEDIAARAAEIQAHHEAQFTTIAQLVGSGHDTIGAVAKRMRWSRRWPELGPLDRIMAIGEANAHLRTLETRGALRLIEDSPRRFALA